MNYSFTIIDNNANDPVIGTFAGLPQGANLTIGSILLQISYSAGAGANNVTLTRVPLTSPTINSLSFLTNSIISVTGTGQSGLAYVLQTTTNLNLPITWADVSTNTAATNGLLQFFHTNAPELPNRFYRVHWP
jgi:hypothetical protein